MDYKIVLMKDAEEDFDRFIAYLLFEKKSDQAARCILLAWVMKWQKTEEIKAMIKTYNQKVDFVDFESLNQLIDCILKSERYIKKMLDTA